MHDAVVTELALEQTAEELAETVAAEAPLNTINIRITVTRESPSEAADIANVTTSGFRAVIEDMTNGQVSVGALREASVPEDAI